MSKKNKQLISVVILAFILWFLPHPEALPDNAWHLFALFVSTIVALILGFMPLAQICIIALGVLVITGVLDPTSPKKAALAALSGFGNTTVWLIVAAFFVSTGIIKTGLGKRIAFYCIRFFGKSTLGLGYSIVAGNFILGPVIPSITARSGGLFFPIVKAITEAYGSKPNDGTGDKMGKYLMYVGAQAGILTGVLFLTGMAANPLIGELGSSKGAGLDWMGWFEHIAPIGLILCLAMPILMYYVIKPTIKKTPEAVEMAKKELKAMGKVTRKEGTLIVIIIAMIVFWIFGEQFKIHSSSVAVFGLAMMLLFQVVEWKDIQESKGGWNALVWFGVLLTMSSYLKKLGFIAWFGDEVKSNLLGFHLAPIYYFFVLTILYYYIHYFFASATAQVLALYSSFLVIGISVGLNPIVIGCALAMCSNTYGSLTHYGSGSGVLFFNEGYISVPQWWRNGFIMSILNLGVILTIGFAYWTFIAS